MIAESPFKFLDSYSKEDKDIFFGRDQEIEEVYNKVFQSKTLFVYGESGTGKSSLINCGLANRFKDTDWLPVNVRRGENINDSMIAELRKLSISEAPILNGSFEKNLFKCTRSVYLDYFKPIYFIFDQFEELYLLGTKTEWKEFITGIKSLTEWDLNVHFIFIIRAEYLHFMSEFEEELPEIFTNKLRIEKITRLKAKECIEGPCEVFGITVDDEFSDKLFDQLSPDRNDIELTYLQVFLDKVYKMASEEAGKVDTIVFSKELLDRMGLVSDVLSDFLDEQIDDLPDKETSLTILKAFVTVEGTKRQTSTDEIIGFARSLGQTVSVKYVDKLLIELLERRILKELPDQQKFELRHDALAFKIFEKITTREKELIEVRQFLDYGLVEYKKRGYLLNDRDLSYVQPHLEILELGGDLKKFVDESLKAVQKKQRNRKRIIGIISLIVILCVTSVYGFFDARQQREEAEQQRLLAETQRGKAEENEQEARKQEASAIMSAQLASDAQQLAETNATEATMQAIFAQQQKQIADQQRFQADNSRVEAENQRQIALVQKDSAEMARGQALVYLDQATDQKERVQKLSMQLLASSLGIKSAQIPELDLKSLLALQAFRFNDRYEGSPYQADIYNALYLAYKQEKGDDHNVFKKHTQAVTEIITAGNGIYTTGKDGRILLWSEDLASSRELVNTGMINNTMALSPDGSRLAVGTQAREIQVYNSRNGDLILKSSFHAGEIWEVLFLDDNVIISSAEDKSVMQWDSRLGTSTIIAKFDNQAHALALNGSTNSLWIGLDNGDIYELDLKTNTRDEIHGEKDEMITKLSFNHSNNRLVMGFENGSILMWDPISREVLETLPGHTAQVSDIKFSTDDRFLISGGFDRRSLLWNMSRIKEPPIVIGDHQRFVWAVGFGNGESEIISGELGGEIKKNYLEMKEYADRMCYQLTRNLTQKEWETFMTAEILFEKTCTLN